MTDAEIEIKRLRERAERAEELQRGTEQALKEFTPEDIRGMAYDTNALLSSKLAEAEAQRDELSKALRITGKCRGCLGTKQKWVEKETISSRGDALEDRIWEIAERVLVTKQQSSDCGAQRLEKEKCNGASSQVRWRK